MVLHIYDEKDSIHQYCNREMVEIDELDAEDLEQVKALIQEHYHLTDSKKARTILEQWEEHCSKFKKVIPTVYKQILKSRKVEEERVQAERGA